MPFSVDGMDMHMRSTLVLIVSALLIVPAAASAQAVAPAPAAPANDLEGQSNVADFIGRGTVFSTGSDEARYQRYRDLRDGGTLDRFRWTSETDSRHLLVQADHIGYRDQRYAAQYNNFGKVKV